MKASILPALVALAAAVALPGGVEASAITLRGSHDSMVRQHAVAKENDFTFLRTPGQIEHLVGEGVLVPMPGNADYRTANVSYAYTRPSTRSFVERLAAEYHGACGAPLVVTSLTRPLSEQPRNASPLSVHPTGMAVDLRVPADASCRGWLEKELLGLEAKGALDVTREYHPPHLHVAVFPERWLAWAAAHPLTRPASAPSPAKSPARAAGPLAASFGPAPSAAGHAADWLSFAALLALAAAALSAAIPLRGRGEPAATRWRSRR